MPASSVSVGQTPGSEVWQTARMATRDPVDRNMVRMELRRFQTRCEAQEGAIRRADTLREVARLGSIPLPFQISEETVALDARAQLRRTAEDRARELVEDFLGQLVRAEPYLRDKLRRGIDDELLNLAGPLSGMKSWAYTRVAAVEQSLSKE